LIRQPGTTYGHFFWRRCKPFCYSRSKGSRGLSEDLGSAVPDSTYFVVTLHTHEYARREWGRYFEIVEIFESRVANHRDMVVMRRR
jgi:hypothetical protein